MRISLAVELSVSRGVPVEGWGCPNSIRVVRIGHASWAPRKIPPVSASEAEVGTPFMVLTMTWSGPFGAGLGGSVVGLLVSVNSVTQRLRALGSTR